MPTPEVNVVPSQKTAEEALKPLVIVCIVYIILDFVFLAIRFVSRFLVRRSELGWDDWFLLPSFICNVGACVIGILIAHYESLTNTPANMPIFAPEQYYSQLVPSLKLIFGLPLVLIPGFTFSRLSILTLYLRIFTGKVTRSLAWVTMFFVIAMGLAFQLTAIFLCHPVNYFWDRQRPHGGVCHDLNTYYRAFGLPNILIDVAILAVPLPAVWTLHASLARKLGLTFMFFTGTIALVASCVRWAIYAHADVRLIVPDTNAELIYIDIIECSTYLIAACLPASYPVLNILIPPPLRTWMESAAAKLVGPSSTLTTTKNRQSAVPRFGRHANAASFARLVDSSNTPGQSRERRRDTNPGAYEHGVSAKAMQTLGSSTHARAGQGEEMSATGRDEALAMQDLRDGDGRHGIIVHTEIEVSQEERIEAVMGL